MKYKLLIPTAYGIEAVVKRQLYRLGYADTFADNGRIVVDNCTFDDIATLNVNLRCGERVLISLATFDATTFDQLYDGIKAIRWTDIVAKDSKVVVVCKSVESTLFAHNAIQSIGKKAIVDSVGQLTESGATMTVEIALYKDKATINLDTTGVGLHKRGYRLQPYSAPLKETTAAALIDLSVWHKDKILADCFCGSGTIPIEAALIARNIAPGINRTFDFVNWQHLNTTPSYNNAIQCAKDSIINHQPTIIASDISDSAIEIAKYHARQAGVEQCISFSVADVADFCSKDSYGVIISNPPYGERLLETSDLFVLTKSIGRMYRSLDNWSMYLLTPFESTEKCIGRRADKKRYLYNAGIKCSYYSFLGAKPPKD